MNENEQRKLAGSGETIQGDNRGDTSGALNGGIPQKKERNCKICIEGLIDDKKMHDVSESHIKEYFQDIGTID